MTASNRGQVSIIALFSTLMLVLAVVLVASAGTKFFTSIQGSDPLVNLLLDYAWYIIGLVVLVSFFVWMAVVKGQ